VIISIIYDYKQSDLIIKKNMNHTTLFYQIVLDGLLFPEIKVLLNNTCIGLNSLLNVALLNSNLIHCAPAFYPLLSKTNKGRLDTIQLKAGRIITGCVKATNREAVLLEANLELLQVYMDAACAVAAEKYRRMPKNDPLAIMTLSVTPPSRLMKTAESGQHVSDRVLTACGFRIGRLTSGGNEIVPRDERVSNLVDVRNRGPIYSGIPPWEMANAYKVTYVTNLVKKCKNTDPPELRKI
jgi:hypothetical protein